MKKIKAFVVGMWEFRASFTAYYTSYELTLAYNAGREFAHRLTLWRYGS
jgi:hypothetical protein